MTTTTSPVVAELERAERDLAKALERAKRADDAYAQAAAEVPFYEAENIPEFQRRADAHTAALEARGLVEHLRRASLRDRLGEVDVSEAEDHIRAALSELVAACDKYRERVEQGQAICASTRPLTGQSFGSDERIAEWRRFAVSALETELIPAGLSGWGAAKLDAALAEDEERADA